MKIYNSLPSLIKNKGKQYRLAPNPWPDSLASRVDIREQQIRIAKEQGKTYKTVHVLAHNLKKAKDENGNPYKPTTWIFVEQ